MHEGHRQRMRERFRTEGLDGFSAHEVLEMLLFYTRSRGNVNPLAHRLLDTFGSLRGVLQAPVEQLMAVEGVGEETASLLALMVPIFRRYELCLCEETKKLHYFRDVEAYCRALLTGLNKERLYVISVSAQMKVLGHRVVGHGDLTQVMAYPRLVVETALNHNAFGVILCHNHPGGEAVPSVGDVEVTRALEAVLAKLDIALLDHIIIAGGKAYSMIRAGDFICTVTHPDSARAFREDVGESDLWV